MWGELAESKNVGIIMPLKKHRCMCTYIYVHMKYALIYLFIYLDKALLCAWIGLELTIVTRTDQTSLKLRILQPLPYKSWD